MTLPYVFSTKTLPEERFMPEIGNGHIATAIFNPYVHMNGLYNGEGTASCRARIPSLVCFTIRVDGLIVDHIYSLNMKEGIFTESQVCQKPSFELIRETFIHRLDPCLLITSLHIKTESSCPITLTLENLAPTNPLVSPDIDFSLTEQRAMARFDAITPLSYNIANGRTRVAEISGLPLSPVTIVWFSSSPLTETMVVDQESVDIVLMASINSDATEAEESLVKAMQCDIRHLRASHITKWSQIWDGGRIEVDPEENLLLAQTLYSTLYFLMCSLPNENKHGRDFIGLSPGGLAHGCAGAEIDQDYLGHSFWDTESWMFPPILFFHPDQARFLIQARLRILDQAIRNAIMINKDGAKFPWESAVTGIETTPWSPAGDFEIHVTGDIAFAVRQFIYASLNKAETIVDMGLDRLVEEIAAWWQSCAVKDSGGESYCINGVMGPDEYHYPVNNSAYTNFIAKMALQLPSYVLDIIGKHDPRTAVWSDIASKIPVRTAKLTDGRVYHPEFDGFFPKSPCKTKRDYVKQADVILLGYPLEMEMDDRIRSNDLDIYREITDPGGPAMTWSMFAIGYLELKRYKDAAIIFKKFADNAQPPFGVWSEVPGGDGAVNFLTGMGGFLQSVINGYGGFRLHSDCMQFDPSPLPDTTQWSIIGAKYLDCHINFTFNFVQNFISVTLIAANPTVNLAIITSSGAKYLLDVGRPVTYPIERSKLIRLA